MGIICSAFYITNDSQVALLMRELEFIIDNDYKKFSLKHIFFYEIGDYHSSRKYNYIGIICTHGVGRLHSFLYCIAEDRPGLASRDTRRSCVIVMYLL